MTEKILFISDANQVEPLRPLLRDQGYEIECFTDSIGASAVALRLRPRLIVLSVDRTLVDGPAQCALLKKNRALSSIPVLFQVQGPPQGGASWQTPQGSAAFVRSETELRRLTINHGAQGYLLPGADPRQNAARLLEFLRERRPILPDDEAQRLEVLHGAGILDTPPDSLLDDVCYLARYLTEAPTSLVSLVDEDRQWFKARVGMDVTQTSRDQAFCAYAIHRPSLFLVADAREDDRFAQNPLVTGPPYIRFYAGVPLQAGAGSALGTLCVIDQRPRQLSEQQRDGLIRLGRQAVSRLGVRLRRMSMDLHPRRP